MASKKRKASENQCSPLTKKRIKSPIASSTPCAGPSGIISSISGDEGSSEIFFTSSSNKFSSSSDAFQSCKEPTQMEFPESVSVMKFAECRAKEISSLMQAVETKRPKLAFQQLPHHMRRRAASHNANRVPRRLREKVLKEIEDTKKTKRPSRKHRRRPRNLLQEYNRRQREHIWLETHIWFAKRFKMTKLWGYKIPLYPNDKSVKAGFRASSRHVLVQDLSYMCCLELVGLEETLLQGLSQITSVSIGLTFASKACLTGTREGNVMLYNSLTFPYGALGPVSFMWCPRGAETVDGDVRNLWIWCHPSMYIELVNVLKMIFKLPDQQDGQSLEDIADNNKTMKGGSNTDIIVNRKLDENANGNLQKLHSDSQSPIVPLDKKLIIRCNQATRYSSDDVRLTLLKDTLVRHRLIGPLSQAVIADALRPADVQCSVEPVAGGSKWWETYYSCEENRISHKEQRSYWTQMQQWKCPDVVPPRSVLALTVKDPRLDLPKIQKKISCEFDDRQVNGGNLPDSNIYLSRSPIWNEVVRNDVTAMKLPENKLNKLRSQCLVPGTRLELGREESRIPIIAIQQPGVNGYSSGWDIIAPLGWSMAFWIAFIYRGARAFGLRELRTISREAGIALFPFNFPDTKSGQDWEEDNRKALITKHFRYPPKKRPSFIKLGILTPFFMPWYTLVGNWIGQLSQPHSPCNRSDTSEMSLPGNYFVLRTKRELRRLSEVCELLAKLSMQRRKNVKQFNTIKTYLEELRTKIYDGDLKSALVCIKLTCSNRGNPNEFSGVYMPSDSDLLMFKENSAYRGPVESKHAIPKDSCGKLKKRPRKKKGSLATTETGKTVQTAKEDLRLQRPQVTNLIRHCTRQLMGLIEVGNYSILKGCGAGLGHCSLIALLEVLRKCFETNTRAIVLVRSQSGFQYRFMNVDVSF